MKTWKFTLSFLAASIMANAPLANAAVDAQQKKEFNKFMKEQVLAQGATMNSFYQDNKQYFDGPSKAWIEAWMENFGGESLPTVDTQTIQDKNGSETIKFIISKNGATATVTVNSQDEDYFTINGQKFYYLEATNLPTIINRLAGKDSSLKAMALEMNSDKAPARDAQNVKSDYLTTQQFMKLPAIKKVEYMQHWRGVIEAAQRVNFVRNGAQNETESHTYAQLHPAIASMVAWAANSIDGTKCVVAGRVSTYVNGSCSIDSNDSFNKMCVAKGLGNVACNPLVYGLNTSGPETPFCLTSTNQPDFTQTATIQCNAKSPINGAQYSKERNASYKRILTTYLMNKGGDPKNFARCFNTQSELDPNCNAIFQPQLDDFIKLQTEAEAACSVKTLPDQPDACASLRARTLELVNFVKGDPDLIVVTGSKEKAMCEKDPKKKWDSENKKCKPIAAGPIKDPRPKDKDTCKTNKSKCTPWLAIGIFAGITGLIWLLAGKKKKKPAVKTPPPDIKVPIPTTTMSNPPPTSPPPTSPPPTVPPSEGGSGTGSGTNGGVRGADGI